MANQRVEGPSDLPRATALDDLRLIGVVAVIVMHAFEGYSKVGDWLYQDVAEVRLDPMAAGLAAIVAAPLMVAAMPLFFVIAGLVAPCSLSRRGPQAFVRERIARLCGQALLATVLVWPLTVAALHHATGRGPDDYLTVLRDARPLGDNGPAWMLPILAACCLGYAALATRRTVPHPRLSDGRLLYAAATAVAAATYLTRLGLPAGSQQVGNLHVWQWPQLIGAFVVGLAGAGRGWVTHVPTSVLRLAGSLTGAGALTLWAAVGIASGTGPDTLGGGTTMPATLWAAGEGLVSAAAPVVLIAVMQRRTAGKVVRRESLRGRLHAASFAAYLVQGPVLIAVALSLRPAHLVASVKLLILASTASAICLVVGVGVTARRRSLMSGPRGPAQVPAPTRSAGRGPSAFSAAGGSPAGGPAKAISPPPSSHDD